MPELKRDARHRIAFELNGRPVSGEAEPRMLLTDFLKQQFGISGVHVGCEHGVCGACTIQLDGIATRACLLLAVQVEGRAVRTVEALADEDGGLSPLQAAFRRHFALQCGYCTPGILMSLDDYLARNPEPSEADIRDVLTGHLCRCTGYAPIIRAALDAAAEVRRT